MGRQTLRHYGATQTPLARMLACAEVTAETKARLRREQAALNPFAVRREVDRQMKEIEACRRRSEASLREEKRYKKSPQENGSEGGWTATVLWLPSFSKFVGIG